MAYSFLVFDFGGNEEVAQQARHKVDGWKQGFRLGKKLELKFDRKESEAKPESPAEAAPKQAKEGSKSKSKTKTSSKPSKPSAAPDATAGPAAEIQLLVRLDFSDHEKLSHQRWLERIPAEEPFKTVKSRIIRAGDPEFNKIAELFENLD